MLQITRSRLAGMAMGLTFVALPAAFVLAQFAAEPAPQPSSSGTAGRMMVTQAQRALQPGASPAIARRSPDTSGIQAAAKALREANDDASKAAARTKLVELLTKYFDDDMKTREDELEKVEKRVEKLRSLLDRRAKKKEEIIELQTKVFENDADGLGLFNSAVPAPMQPATFYSGGGTGRYAPLPDGDYITPVETPEHSVLTASPGAVAPPVAIPAPPSLPALRPVPADESE